MNNPISGETFRTPGNFIVKFIDVTYSTIPYTGWASYKVLIVPRDIKHMAGFVGVTRLPLNSEWIKL